MSRRRGPHNSLSRPDVGEAIAKGFDALSLWAVGRENRITAGWDFDFNVPAFGWDEAVRFFAPLQRLPVAERHVDKEFLGLHDVTGIAKSSDPNANFCCAVTHGSRALN